MSLVLLTLAACGSGSTSGQEDRRLLTVTAVRSATEAEGTAHVSFVLRQQTTGIPNEPDQSLEISAEGVVDVNANRGRFRMAMSNFDGEGDERLQPTGDLIVDGDTGYTRSAGADASEDEKWRQLPPGGDLTGLGMFGLDVSFVTGLGLDVFGLPEPNDVEHLGQQDLRGTITSHYRVTVEPPEEEAQDDRIHLTFFADGEPFAYDVWVDDDDRMRRMNFRVDLTASTKKFVESFEARDGGTTTTFPTTLSLFATVDIEAWDFGDSVDIEVPPPDQIATAK